VIRVPERLSGQNYADVPAAVRDLADLYGLRVVVVGPPNSLPPELFATKRETFLQPRDLLFESAVFPEVETVSCISLAEGLQKVIANQLLTKQVSA
jgi:hypothetical protein